MRQEPDPVWTAALGEEPNRAASLLAGSGVAVRLPSLDEIARRWAEIEPVLARATDRAGLYAPIDVLRAACAGTMAVWLVECGSELRALAVTELRVYPRRRVLEIPFTAGSGVDDWHEPLLAALEKHARALGCSRLGASGRRGWVKYGLEDWGAILGKNLE